jgi:hypothetical protein
MPEYRAELSIEGLQELQAENNKMIAALRPGTALGRMLTLVVADLSRYAITITHVDTGALRASHRMAIYDDYGEVYVDPSATNPRSGVRTAVYGAIEEARGGEHAFYTRTVNERGASAMDRARAYLEQTL